MIKKKELQFRTLEPKKQYVVKKPKTILQKENIPEEHPFEKLLHSFLQLHVSNPEKISKLKKDTFKIITQHRELNELEEEHRCTLINTFSPTRSLFLRSIVIPHRVLKVVTFLLLYDEFPILIIFEQYYGKCIRGLRVSIIKLIGIFLRIKRPIK